AQTADDTMAVGTVGLQPELVVVVAGEFVDLLEGIGIEERGDALTGGLLAALVLIVHRALVAGVGSVPTLGEVLDALGCGPWGIRHTSTITTRTPIIVHSHQKNLKWTGEQPTQSSSRRRRLRPPRCRGPRTFTSGADLDDTCSSTNDELARLVRDGGAGAEQPAEFTIRGTDFQNSGHGRLGRTW